MTLTFFPVVATFITQLILLVSSGQSFLQPSKLFIKVILCYFCFPPNSHVKRDRFHVCQAVGIGSTYSGQWAGDERHGQGTQAGPRDVSKTASLENLEFCLKKSMYFKRLFVTTYDHKNE